MDLPKRNLFSKSIPIASDNNPSVTRKIVAFQESNENAMPRSKKEPPPTKNFMSPTVSSATKTKILGERNLADDPSFTQFEATPNTAAHSRVSGDRKSSSSCNVPYDPVTNYLSPRPQFLRYDPDRRREFMQRMEGAEDEDDASFQDEIEEGDEDDNDSDQEEEEDEEEEGGKASYFGTVCKLLLLLGILVSATCYVSSMNSVSGPSLPYIQENYPTTSRQPGNLSTFSEGIWKSPEICLLQEDVTDLHLRAPHVVVRRDDGLSGEELLDEKSSAHLVDSRTGDEVTQIEEISDAHFVDSRTGDDVIQNDQPISGGIAGRVDLVEEESLDGIELVNGTLNSDHSAAEEKNEEVLDQSLELLVKERNTSVAPGEGNEVEKSVRLEMMETCGVIHIGDLLLRDSPAQTPALDSLAHQYSALSLPDSSETETSSGDKEVQRAEGSGLSQVPQVQIDSITPRLISEVSTVLGIDLGRGILYLFISLTAIIGLLFILCKYFTKYHRSSKPGPLPSSKAKAVFAKKSTTSAVTVREDIENEGSKSVILNHSSDKDKEFLGVSSTSTETSFDQKLERKGVEGPRSSVPSSLFNDEDEKSYATQPPTVELLGEFFVAKESVSGTGSGQKVERKVDEGSRFSRPERNSSRKRSSAGKVFPTSLGESPLNGMSTAQKESPLREEDTGYRGGEPVQMVATPLRRSSRLRSKVSSPKS